MTARKIALLLFLTVLVLLLAGCGDPEDLKHGLTVLTVDVTHDTVVGETTTEHASVRVWAGHSDLIGGLLVGMMGGNVRAPIHFDEEARVVVTGRELEVDATAERFVLDPAEWLITPDAAMGVSVHLSEWHESGYYTDTWICPSAELSGLPDQVTAGDTLVVGPTAYYMTSLDLRTSLNQYSGEAFTRDPEQNRTYFIIIPAETDSVYVRQEVGYEYDDDVGPWLVEFQVSWTKGMAVVPAGE